MAACTFFGHWDCIGLCRSELEKAIEDLIRNHDVDLFYVGNEGQFDALVHWVLFAMKKKYPHIRYAVVLAYPPKNIPGEDYSDTMLPEGIETVHPRYAITWRNRWMLQQADYVITYVTHPWGGAARFAEEARRKGRRVINFAEYKISRS